MASGETSLIDGFHTQRAILILGPGRSGTSTLTRSLGALNVYLGTCFRRPVRKNPRGSWEEVHLLRLSKAVRRSVGLRADSVRLLDDRAWDNPKTRALQRRMAIAIRRHFGDKPVWAFKYGGNTRILPFWLDLLPRLEIDPAFVFSYRNPLSIAPSRAKLNPARGRPEHNNLEWLANVVPYFDRLKGHPLVVVDYDRLLDDPRRELLRIAARLHLPVTEETARGIDRYTDEFLRADWRHTCFSDADLKADTGLHPLVRQAALLLSRLAKDEADLDDPEVWRQWRKIQKDLQAQAPMLQLIDDLKAENRRARWWDLSMPLRVVWNKLPVLRIR